MALVPAEIADFLGVATPPEWIVAASDRLPEMLNDHANCELKAASTALGFLYRYPERTALVQRMSKLAREELRHFEQVRKIMTEMSIAFRRLDASRYAGALRRAARHAEPYRLLDLLLIGALIEARSCERFAQLVPVLPERLGEFYAGLLASEARHFENYLGLAASECGATEDEIAARLNELKAVEKSLIVTPDSRFRFHSGVPA